MYLSYCYPIKSGGWGVGGVWDVGWVSDGGQKMPIRTFRGSGTERARLGTFRGFGTERARLDTFNHNFEIFTQNEHLPAQRFFLSFGRKSKNRPTCFDFEKKKNPDLRLLKIF